MVLEAERHGCVREVLVIAAALSIQDPRERPAEHRQAADEMHRRFRRRRGIATSSSFVALWDHLRERAAGAVRRTSSAGCAAAEYLNYLRVREWQDLFSQLRQVDRPARHPPRQRGRPPRPRPSGGAGRPAQPSRHARRHRVTSRERSEYNGAHGSKFAIGSGSVLPQAAAVGHRRRARRDQPAVGPTAASVQPEWAESIGKHLDQSTATASHVGRSAAAGRCQ